MSTRNDLFMLGSIVMGARAVYTNFLLGLLAVIAVAGWGWGWHERGQASETAFLEHRLSLLDADNQRLTNILADHQRAATSAADNTHRAEIERSVAKLRELAFEQPVTYREIPRADLPAILRRKLAQQVPDQEFVNTGISLAALGLLPPGLDLKKTYLGLLGEQIGAFYDQHSAELFTFSGQPLDNSQNRVILAHELTHALEDQHFHLALLPLEAKGDDDRALAASALVEGDATLVMSQYMLGDLSAASLKDTLTSAWTSDMRQIAAAPRFLRETLLFPYLRGQEFCQALYQSGGWAALAEAFRHPPDSTAQILHPERFLDRPNEPPPTVEFPVASLLGQEPVGNNVLGEFGTRQFLARWLKDEAGAERIAAGWVADRYLVYGDSKTSSFLWKSVWSSPEAASQFAEAAIRCWQERYHLEPGAFSQTSPSKQSAALPDGHHLMILRQDDRVILIDAQDGRWEAAIQGLCGGSPAAESLHDVHPR